MGGRPLAVAMLLVISSAGAQQNASTVEALRTKILTNMNPKVPPSTAAGIGNQVWVQFRIFKVLSVDLRSGRLQFKVWRRVRWFDDRLAWNPDDFDGISTVLVYPGSPMATDLDNNLWLPHIVTYNSAQMDALSYEAGAAWVRFDGRVHHSVPGLIDITCRYSGLANFPRDELTCPMEVAMWSTSDLITNLTFFADSTDERKLALGDRGCAEISPQSAATAASYQEYQLAPKVDCLKYTREYPCCENVPWTQLWIVFHISRASEYYLRLLELPGILITVLSFGQFWLDASCIMPRVGYGATMFLTSYVLMSLAGDALPSCGEMLWIDYLLFVNLTFTVLALLQTVVTFHYCFGGIGTVLEEGAEEIDFWARRFIPALFAFALSIIYSLEPVDPYAISSKDGWVSSDDVLFSQPMYQGIAPRHNVDATRIVLGPVIIIMVVCASLYPRCGVQVKAAMKASMRVRIRRAPRN